MGSMMFKIVSDNMCVIATVIDRRFGSKRGVASLE